MKSLRSLGLIPVNLFFCLSVSIVVPVLALVGTVLEIPNTLLEALRGNAIYSHNYKSQWVKLRAKPVKQRIDSNEIPTV